MFQPSEINSLVQGIINKILTIVIKSLVQVCLPKSIVQNGMIHHVPAKCDQTCQCLPKSISQNGMIHFVPAKCDEITCTSMFA